MSQQNDIETREALATGEAFVTTLHDVRMVRDRAVAAEREACAKIADDLLARMEAGEGIAISCIAAAIRARGKGEK